LARLGREGIREVLSSTLESLYRDRIKPVGNYIKGRLKEKSSPEGIIKSFQDHYRNHPDLFRVEDGSTPDEPAIFFVVTPAWFKGWIDIDSPDDPYSEELWKELKTYLEDGGHTYAGGRYGMARELAAKKLPFLQDQTLGDICHIVQLAIQHRKIIAYHKKMLKPMQPLSQGTLNGEPKQEGDEIENMPQLVRALFKTLRRHPGGIRLDRMKQMVREECQARLNEMAFQCTKLIEVFKLEPLASTFDLENDGKVFFLRPKDSSRFSDDVRKIWAEVNR